MADSFDPSILDGIAIVGMAGRFPGARNVSEYWKNLESGVESVRFFTDEELLEAGIDPAFLADPNYVKASPVLDGIKGFDAPFFGFSPREAELMDPQQRLFLECAWTALEDAGYDSERTDLSIGVYAGVRVDTYWMEFCNDRNLVHSPEALPMLIGNDKDYLATKVSYKLNLRGPSVSVQTACSSSLVAIVLAYQSLMTYQCDMALAGGVAIRIPQISGYFHRPGGIASPDGHCRAFDADARGSVFGSGLGVVALKRAEDAMRDGDVIYAILRGAAINNDGSAKVGYTAPSVEGQSQVIATAQALAGVDPETISYVEAHGTGTELGDPIEVAALDRVFRTGQHKPKSCALGSVKTNIGHLDTAAGVAGLIKTTLALHNGVLPPSLGFNNPNPKIDFEGGPFFVNTERREWVSETGPRRAGVSSFGIGGTNAHVVLEEAPPRAQSPASERPWHLFPVSARSAEALDNATQNLAAHLRANPEANPADVAAILQLGRRAFPHRRVVAGESLEEVAEALEALDAKKVASGRAVEGDPQIAFLFPGQGAQHVDMGRRLYETEATFRDTVDRCAEVLEPLLSLDLRKILFPKEGSPKALFARRLEETALAQPALFVIEYALAQQWMHWGVQPAVLAGHSIGELTAAVLAGVMSLEDGLRLVAARGRLMQNQPPGRMLSVPAAASKIEPKLSGDLAMAAINAPELCVISGPKAQLEELERQLGEEGIPCRPLHTSHAFHSSLMQGAVEPFTEQVQRVRLSPPRIPMLSNRSGTWLTDEEAVDPTYWASQMRGTVRFEENVRALAEREVDVCLEVGPGRALSTFVRAQLAESTKALTSLPHPKDPDPELHFVASALGRLWLAGARVDWGVLHDGEERHKVSLPTYPFEHNDYWLEKSDITGSTEERRVSKRARGVEGWFWRPSWRTAEPALAKDRELPEGGWLVFLDEVGLGARLASGLQKAGHTVATVGSGKAFEDLGEGRYTLDPQDAEAYGQLLDSLAQKDGHPAGVVWGWTLGAKEGSEAVETSFHRLLALARALANANSPVEVRVLSDGLQAVAGESLLAPEKALLLGPVTVVPQEMPQQRWQSVDVVLPQGDGALDRLAAQLLDELATEPTESQVAWRGFERFVRELEPQALPAAEVPPLKDSGTYLITGGFGGLGYALAENLAPRGARLALLGRTELPPREEWQAALDAPEEGSAAQRIRQVLDLESRGAEVLPLAADVTSLEQMTSALEQVRQRFDGLDGVFHAAGTPGGGLIARGSREAAEAVFAPKLDGTRTLAQALDSTFGPDGAGFLALYSSTIAWTGGVGQVDYCAANSFVDAFARARTLAGGGRTVAIDWDAWQNLGMTAVSKESGPPKHNLLGRTLAQTPELTLVSSELDPAREWVLDEHRILGRPVLPGTAHLELAHSLASRSADEGSMVELHDVIFRQPLRAPESEASVQVISEARQEGSGGQLRILSRNPEGGWDEHVNARFESVPASDAPTCDLDALAARLGTSLAPEKVPGDPDAMQFGARWQIPFEIATDGQEALLRLEVGDDFADDFKALTLHPALLDRVTAFAARVLAPGERLPFTYRKLTVRGPLPAKIVAHAQLRSEGTGTAVLDLQIYDESGSERVAIEGFMLRAVSGAPAVERAGGGTAEPPAFPGGSTGIDVPQGLEALERLLAWGRGPQMAVSPRDLPEAIRRAREGAATTLADQLQPAGASTGRHPRPDLAVPFVAPRNAAEESLAELFGQLLSIEGIGVDDNFFELGGHSLLAIRVVAEIRSRLGVELPMQILFDEPTVARLAGRLEAEGGQSTEGSAPIEIVPRDPEGMTLAFAQERQLFLAQLDPDSSIYNHVAGARLDGALEPAALEHTLSEIVRRHEVLRTTYRREGEGRPVQLIAPPQAITIPMVDLSGLPEAAQQAEQERLIAWESRRPFNLVTGPVIRALLLRFEDTRHLILFAFHHIAGDHWSAGVLVRELATLYGAFRDRRPSPLPELPIQFADFASWQRNWYENQELENHLAYWREQLDGAPELLRLPLDRPRPEQQTQRGAKEPFGLGPELTQRFEELCRGQGVTLFMGLLAVLQSVLSLRSGQDDVVVGAPVAGRDRTELEDLVGCFINALPLRTDLSGNPTFAELLERVRDVTLGAYQRQELPFEKLVEELKPKRDPSHNPIFQVVFNFQSAPLPPLELSGLRLETLHIDTGRAKYDFTLYLGPIGDDVVGAIEYNVDLFDSDTIKRLITLFKHLVEQVVEDPQIPFETLCQTLTDREKETERKKLQEVEKSNLSKLRRVRRRTVQVAKNPSS